MLLIRTEGLKNRLARIRKCAEMIRRRGKALCLPLYLHGRMLKRGDRVRICAIEVPDAEVIRTLDKKFAAEIGS